MNAKTELISAYTTIATLEQSLKNCADSNANYELQWKVAKLTIAKLTVELAEATARSANNALWTNRWKHKFNSLKLEVQRAAPAAPSNYAAEKQRAIDAALASINS